MTAASEPIQLAESVDATAQKSSLDRTMTWLGDRLNPILVKETRQALKSRQFIVTFALLLICAWTWTMFRVAIGGADLVYQADGADFFMGYYLILGVALFVIVPVGAFRSLAAEQEDRTYELMSITTLNPHAIVRGKLGSAVLQMLIYLSAVSPCLAFTYMLRGIDFPTILFILFYTILGSLGLSMISLFAASLTNERHWQTVLLILLIAGLLWTGGIAVFGVTMELFLGASRHFFRDAEFWIGLGACLTGYAGYFALFYEAAASLLTFPSDNRATRLRIVMVAQFLLFTGWMAWGWVAPDWAEGEEELLLIFAVFAMLHWYVMGALMTGEAPELSMRVRRELPHSFLGRVFLTWFNPGPGTGYLLAISGCAATFAVVLLGMSVAEWGEFSLIDLSDWSADGVVESLVLAGVLLVYAPLYVAVGLVGIVLFRWAGKTATLAALFVQALVGGVAAWIVLELLFRNYQGARWQDAMHITLFCVLGIAYAAIYLGVGLWIVRLLRRVTRVGVFLALLVQVVLVLGGLLTALLAEMVLFGDLSNSYSPLHVFDGPYTLAYVIDDGTRLDEWIALTAIVPTAALFVLMMRLGGIVHELRHVRIARPTRVVEDDAALAATKRPPEQRRISPWDTEEIE